MYKDGSGIVSSSITVRVNVIVSETFFLKATYPFPAYLVNVFFVFTEKQS